MVVSENFIQEEFPLHLAIWKNDEAQVEALLNDSDLKKEHLEKQDPRGRTPLLLSVINGRPLVVQRLLNKHCADATFTHSSGWNVIHEAVCRKDPDILRMVLSRRDIQRCKQQQQLVPDLLHELKTVPDFYIEIKWEFSTWRWAGCNLYFYRKLQGLATEGKRFQIPFVNRMLPAGQWHRVFKRGSSLRVDSSTTDSGWDEGISLIFKEDGNDIFILEIDHSSKQVLKQIICSNESGMNGEGISANGTGYAKSIKLRLSNPSVISVMDWETVCFKRKQTHTGGYGSYVTDALPEDVNGFPCKVFRSFGFGIQTKFRTEHLSDKEKSKVTLEQKPGLLKKFLSYLSKNDLELEAETLLKNKGKKQLGSELPEILAEEYFDKDFDLVGRDIGPVKEIKSKHLKFDGTVWICESYPLNLKEQVIPIISLMALTNNRFKSLKDFIELQMPSGFPVKLEVPVYHFINGLITFHNIFGTDGKIDGVKTVEENGKLICILDEKVFDPPKYEFKTAICFGPQLINDDDDFFGIFRENDSSGEPQVDIYEALNAPRTLFRDNSPDDDAEEQLLQRAIEESLLMEKMKSNPDWRPQSEPSEEDDLAGASALPLRISQFQRSSSYEEFERAIAASRAENEAAERHQKEEEETLRRVLQISLQDF